MKIISFDYGKSKIWTAFCDTSDSIPFPDRTLSSRQLVKEYLMQMSPDVVVVWMPFVEKGAESYQLEDCESFVDFIKNNFPKLEVKLVDERMTSIIAKNKMNDMNLKRSKKNCTEDQLSAQLILETYLELVTNIHLS